MPKPSEETIRKRVAAVQKSVLLRKRLKVKTIAEARELLRNKYAPHIKTSHLKPVNHSMPSTEEELQLLRKLLSIYLGNSK